MQRLFKLFASLVAVFFPFGRSLVYHRLYLVGHILIVGPHTGQRLFHHLLVDVVFRQGRRVIRSIARHHLMQQYAQRINIRTPVQFLALHLLGAHVGRRPHDKPFGRSFAILSLVHNLGDTEIQYLRNALVGNNDIGRLYIQMDYLMLMRITHGIQNRLKQSAYPVFHNQARYGTDVFVQTDSVGIFHNQVDIPFFVYMIILEVDDVLMVQAGQMFRLLFQAFPGESVHHLVVDDLDSHLLLLNVFMLCQIHAAHASFSDERDNRIVQYFFSNHNPISF